jgi:hypothetical protein
MMTLSDQLVVRPGPAALMTAMDYGVEASVVSLDAAVAADATTRSELASWLDRLRGRRGCRRARRAVDLADGRSESVGESRLRVSLYALGYTALEPQVVVRGPGDFTARLDLFDRERRIAVEFDGGLKYEGAQGRDALVREKIREDELRSLGVGIARFVWSDLDRPAVLAAKMRRAYASASA